jgi:hypothetical protein
MPYMMQVKLGNHIWVSVAPSDGKPYVYPTETQAREMLEICYPDQCREARLGAPPVVRVIKVKT